MLMKTAGRILKKGPHSDGEKAMTLQGAMHCSWKPIYGEESVLDGDVKAQLWVMTGKVPTRSPTTMGREPPSTGNIFQILNNIEPIWLRNDKNHTFS